VIDDHDAILGAHLVGMPALRDVDGRYLARIARVGDVDQRRAARRSHVTDVEDISVDPDLTAARAIHMRNLLGV
jgi:hypothetical protein